MIETHLLIQWLSTIATLLYIVCVVASLSLSESTTPFDETVMTGRKNVQVRRNFVSHWPTAGPAALYLPLISVVLVTRDRIALASLVMLIQDSVHRWVYRGGLRSLAHTHELASPKAHEHKTLSNSLDFDAADFRTIIKPPAAKVGALRDGTCLFVCSLQRAAAARTTGIPDAPPREKVYRP